MEARRGVAGEGYLGCGDHPPGGGKRGRPLEVVGSRSSEWSLRGTGCNLQWLRAPVTSNPETKTHLQAPTWRRGGPETGAVTRTLGTGSAPRSHRDPVTRCLDSRFWSHPAAGGVFLAPAF